MSGEHEGRQRSPSFCFNHAERTTIHRTNPLGWSDPAREFLTLKKNGDGARHEGRVQSLSVSVSHDAPEACCPTVCRSRSLSRRTKSPVWKDHDNNYPFKANWNCHSLSTKSLTHKHKHTQTMQRGRTRPSPWIQGLHYFSSWFPGSRRDYLWLWPQRHAVSPPLICLFIPLNTLSF